VDYLNVSRAGRVRNLENYNYPRAAKFGTGGTHIFKPSPCFY
jgi:hypothetical protein